MSFNIIISTCKTKDEAFEIAKTLAESDLASCIQIDDVKSFYKFEGEIYNEIEYRLMIKSKEINYQLIENVIKRINSYKNPQIISIRIDGGSKEYMDYLSLL